MDFITIAKQRMSVRDYKETKVEPEKLEQILEAAHVAPTAANLQPIRLIAVQSEEGPQSWALERCGYATSSPMFCARNLTSRPTWSRSTFWLSAIPMKEPATPIASISSASR